MGDRGGLEDQVAKAATSPITSGQPDEKAVIDRLSRIADHAPLFKAAFSNEPQPVTAQNIAKAISASHRVRLPATPLPGHSVILTKPSAQMLTD